MNTIALAVVKACEQLQILRLLKWLGSLSLTSRSCMREKSLAAIKPQVTSMILCFWSRAVHVSDAKDWLCRSVIVTESISTRNT